MSLRLFLWILLSVITFGNEGVPFKFKRNLWQFKQMIEKETGRRGLDYNGYGCYCGLGGKGTPLDALDRCCMKHDKCYDNIKARKLCGTSLHVYLTTYKTKGKTNCVPASGYTRKKTAYCKHAVCSCDSEAANCFARERFDPKFAGWTKSKC